MIGSTARSRLAARGEVRSQLGEARRQRGRAARAAQNDTLSQRRAACQKGRLAPAQPRPRGARWHALFVRKSAGARGRPDAC
mmetsp:Transcript_20795/g.46069  ORF Transcript_20795/g.46069 Transcript_20795/m.46069 type:complete len:82 (+) Transcript_20795:117-362(+)